VMIPGMIAEDDDRPVPMEPKLDVLDFWSMIRAELPGVNGLCTQVTAFMEEPALRQRLTELSAAGMEGVVFVGVPRTMNDGEGSGVAPTDALSIYRQLLPNRGVILIPTRDGEQGRLNFKCNQGATYGMTQLLYSDAIVGFLADFAKNTDHRPEILLSFGFVPAMETRVGLINWLIQDPGNAAVAAEQAFVKRLAASEPDQKRRLLVDLYKRVLDGVIDLGFPVSVHLEATYGVSGPAFATFAEMLAYWSPAQV
jgi:Mycobacterial methylenetetrahydrofolate reductase